jgi:hypothetical protein
MSAENGEDMLKLKKKSEPLPPRICVYGPPKIGKSTFGAAASAPIFLATEAGVDNLDVAQTEVIRTWAEMLSAIKDTAETEYQTVVIDTLNGLVELLAQHVCSSQFCGDMSANGFGSFGRGWASVASEISQIFAPLDAARQRGKTILLLAHTGVQSVRNPNGTDYSRFAPDMDRKVWSRVSAWVDMILRADYDTVVKSDGKQGKAVSAEQRILHCTGSASEDVGVRCGYDLPDRLPLSWDAVAEHLGKRGDIGKQVFDLFHGLPADEQGKALAYLGISKIDQIDSARQERVRAVLNRLQMRQNAAKESK